MNNKKIKLTKKGIIIIIGLILLISLITCVLIVSKPQKKQAPSKKVEEKEKNNKINIIDPESNTRPFAIMINCHNNALPQMGLDKAYIVYELMVEGGITRMMALFKDVDFDKVGSIRSARTQYLMYMYENDAIYVHAGGAKDALNQISNEGINDIDVDGQYGMRDTTLNRPWEHTLFTSTELLNKAVSNNNYRTTTENKSLLKYSAESLKLSEYDDAKNANYVSIKYSDYRTSNYEYDSKSKMYLRSMDETPNVDLQTGEQYKVKNIIAYSVNYSLYTYNNYSGYQKLDNIGTGEGLYISEGYAIPITWEKSSTTSKTIYKVKSTGKELVVNDGNTYIQIYPTSGQLNIN